VATEEFEELKFLKKIVPNFPAHEFEEIMSRKSEVFAQGVCAHWLLKRLASPS
jgi:hypothetical protein